MHTFGYSTDAVKKTDRWLLFHMINTIVSMVIDLFLLIFFLKLDTKEASELEITLLKLIFAGCVAGTIYAIFVFFRLIAARDNLKKNRLEISSTHVCGVCTNKPQSHDDEKYFRLEFSQIDKLELKSVNVAANEFWTLYIYSAEGLYKMAINDARKAGSIIYKEIFRAREAAKAEKEESTQKVE